MTNEDAKDAYAHGIYSSGDWEEAQAGFDDNEGVKKDITIKQILLNFDNNVHY